MQERIFYIPEFEVHGNGDIPIEMDNEKEVEKVAILEPLVFTTAFDAEQLVERTNELSREDKRAPGVVEYADGLVHQLMSAEPAIKNAVEQLRLDEASNQVLSLACAGITAVAAGISTLFGAAGLVGPFTT